MPRGQLRRSFRQQLADSQRAATLRASGLTYRQIGAEMRVDHMTAWRLAHWHKDMIEAHGGFFVRANRLPLRNGSSWDEGEFERRAAVREKIKETLAAQEALDREQQVRTDAARATRDAERARRDEGREWVDGGSDPSKAPTWLREALDEKE